jgi:hypothetical protein
MSKFLDASSALSFLTQQASYIETEVYRTKYPEIQYPNLIPVDTSAGEWARSIEFFSMNTVGKADWFHAEANDMPRADIDMNKFDVKVEMAGIGYGYNLDEIGYAQRVNISLTAERAIAARRAYEEFMEGVVLIGDTRKNWTGLLNSAAVTPVTVTADGTGSSTLWINKTGDQIARDINDALTVINTGTLGVEYADTLLLPIAQFNLLITKRLGTNGEGGTVWEWLQKANVYTITTGNPLRVLAVRQLSTAGAGSSARLVAYRRDPGVVKLHVPMTHRFLPVWQTGPMRFDVPGVFRTSGVDIRRPGSFAYRDGI